MKRKVSEDEILQAAAASLEASEVDPETLDLEDAVEIGRDVPPPVNLLKNGSVSLSFEQLMALVQATKGDQPTYAQMVELATKAAQAGAEKIKPKELTTAEVPRISAFNPQGDRDFPRPKLKCHMYFGSAPLEAVNMTREEIEALNQITPGHYRIKKMDGASMVVEIKGQVNSNQQIDRLWLLLPEGDDQKNLYPPLVEFARQCNNGNRVEPVLLG